MKARPLGISWQWKAVHLNFPDAAFENSDDASEFQVVYLKVQIIHPEPQVLYICHQSTNMNLTFISENSEGGFKDSDYACEKSDYASENSDCGSADSDRISENSDLASEMSDRASEISNWVSENSD